jgi:hypothetical protein
MSCATYSRSGRTIYLAGLVLLISLATACSGGAGGGGTGGSSNTGPSVTANATNFAATAALTDTAPSDQVQLTVNNPTGVAIYFTYTYQRTAIAAFVANGPISVTSTQQSVILIFSLWPPALMGRRRKAANRDGKLLVERLWEPSPCRRSRRHHWF